MYKHTLRPFLFWLTEEDPEQAHEAAMVVLSQPWMQHILRLYAPKNPVVVRAFGLEFPHQVGLAAGFDKNAVAIQSLQELFGFLEIGTIVPKHQKGEPRPRIFRLPGDEAIINRLGFNSDGVQAVAERLRQARPNLRIPVGASLGKMKETLNEEAAQDYIEVLCAVRELVDYMVINVSSPNTPEIRRLQAKKYLESLLRDVIRAENDTAKKREQTPRPVLAKIAPDLTDREIVDILEACDNTGVSGIIAVNTTISRTGVISSLRDEAGGLSGQPLFECNLKVNTLIGKEAPRLPRISVGGIGSRDQANRALDTGACLLQILTAFVYEGPAILQKLVGHNEGGV